MWKWNFICWLVSLITSDPKKRGHHFRRLRDRVNAELGRYEDNWEVTRTYTKTSICRPVVPTSKTNIAVVVQGPVIEEDNQTFESLKSYLDLFPGNPIILSTWDTTPPSTLSAIENLGVHVVTSPEPEHPGPANLNMQIVSTRCGLRKAKELGTLYAVKTRTDSRMHAPRIADYLVGLLKAFPIDQGGAQQERIAVLDHATRLYIPYHPSDILMFGRVEDLTLYWSMPLAGPEVKLTYPQNFDEWVSEPMSEVMLCRHFLEQLDIPLDGSIQQWWRILSDRFICVDRSSLNFLWPKYNYHLDHRLSDLDEYSNWAVCTFRDWINISQQNLDPPVTLEDLRGQKLNAILPSFDMDWCHKVQEETHSLRHVA
ncbi:WavE lipopolysaccharide synthesis [Planctomycetes bacterium CA13]|uniref:WavE lipopolysaccharide synthesis n=1 Tax=Novipirellula herctigrandis TaxID=2527986 RepID=A0A5C5Z7C5_9BACT|nr:WavE lipopolysaccharide synthesis [Planctomycetes bacterium CA13]